MSVRVFIERERNKCIENIMKIATYLERCECVDFINFKL